MRKSEIPCKSRTVARAMLALVLAVGLASGAQAVQPTPAEMQLLSPLCQANFSKDLPRKQSLAPFAYELTGSCGVHHTCNGELAMIKYRSAATAGIGQTSRDARARAERHRKGLLASAVSEYGDETRCAPPTYPLLPMILTERGKALSLQNNHAAAARDFGRALEIDPNYAAARAGLAAAQARAAAQR